ncbi:lipopolysaccharide-induced tumor necrosis factor-alpha factor homolog [Branchiostoma floridae]|uniref:Lipopolysaccharide-induced tumor necrosis factor-alpha factor homolog n=1 Tax=Branchiostoma floridae TaxID=7739 RepID=A0A9J7KXK5_BRAFL|nr:lipopolysaccharide-induced tumor necrosis factor-alpha factor homolog [Branchiostoma floridae]
MSAPGYPQQVQAPVPGQVPMDYNQPPPPPPPMGTTVVVSQPGAIVVAGQRQFTSHEPVQVTCSTCQQLVQTRVDYEIGLMTWVAMGGLCLIGCDLGCCLIPLCVKQLKDARHSCPNCNTHLGSHQLLK